MTAHDIVDPLTGLSQILPSRRVLAGDAPNHLCGIDFVSPGFVVSPPDSVTSTSSCSCRIMSHLCGSFLLFMFDRHTHDPIAELDICSVDVCVIPGLDEPEGSPRQETGIQSSGLVVYVGPFFICSSVSLLRLRNFFSGTGEAPALARYPFHSIIYTSLMRQCETRGSLGIGLPGACRCPSCRLTSAVVLGPVTKYA
jgi:hypothetical protein